MCVFRVATIPCATDDGEELRLRYIARGGGVLVRDMRTLDGITVYGPQ